MRNIFSLVSVAAIGFVVVVLGASGVHADDTIQVCIDNTAEKSMHFEVHFKNSGKTVKMDSEPFDTGEKCLDIPMDSTNLELNVYKKMFIIWDKVCTKSWPTTPPESVRGKLAESSSGIECVGI